MKHRWKKISVATGLVVVMCMSMAACSFLPESEPEYEIVASSQGMYAYETLNEEEKQVYNEIVYAIEHRLESIKVSTLDEKLLDKAHWAVYYDHCEYFWSETYQYEIYTNFKDEVVKLVFWPIYTMDEEQQASYQSQIDAKVDAILAGAPTDGSDYDKALYVYRTLIEENDYDLDSEHNQNIISVFVNNETVCLGYSYGAQYLLNKLGVDCTTIYGTSEGEAHSWNLITMDGEYYYMDVTWGEVSYWEDVNNHEVPPEEGATDAGEKVNTSESEDNTTDKSETINYCYFGVSDADTAFMAEHEAYAHVPVPACTATENNYFIKEGLYFETWDRHAVGDKIEAAYDGGEENILLKFGSKEVYDKAFEYLIERSNWYRYVDKNQITYVDHFEENVLMLEF